MVDTGTCILWWPRTVSRFEYKTVLSTSMAVISIYANHGTFEVLRIF
jgi:hypothetical protein